MKQVAKLSEAVGEGRYEELLEILGRHPDKSSDALELDPNEEFRVVEGLLLADASGEIVRHPYVNNQLNKLLARWAFKTATGGGFRLPGFALMDDGYLFLKDGKVFSGSDWIPEHKAIVQLASKYGLCVRYPIRMVDDLLPFGNLSDEEILAQLNKDLCRQNARLPSPKFMTWLRGNSDWRAHTSCIRRRQRKTAATMTSTGFAWSKRTGSRGS